MKSKDGDKVKDKYAIICQIGKGACGAVYLVRNTDTKK